MFITDDNYVFYLKTNGQPADEISRKFALKKEIGDFGRLKIGGASSIKVNKRFHLGLCVINADNNTYHIDLATQLNHIKNAFINLRELIINDKIDSFSIPQGKEVNNIE